MDRLKAATHRDRPNTTEPLRERHDDTPEELIEAYKEKHKGSQFSRGGSLKNTFEISRLCALLDVTTS